MAAAAPNQGMLCLALPKQLPFLFFWPAWSVILQAMQLWARLRTSCAADCTIPMQ